MSRGRKLGSLAVSAGLGVGMVGLLLSTPVSAASNLKLSKPFTIGFLWQISGEGPNATSDSNDGAMLAVQQINAAGGVGGKKLVTSRQTFTPISPQPATTDFLQLAQKTPDIIIGLTGPSVAAVLPDVTHAGIPTMGLEYAPQGLYNAKTNAGSPWFFTVPETQTSQGAAGAQYLVKGLKQKKIGVIAINTSYGQTTSAGSLAVLHKAGLQATTYQKYPVTTTDLTQEVVAVQGSQGLLNWGYPNTVALQLQEFKQSGLTIPTVSSEAAGIAVSDGLVKSTELGNLYAVSACAPGASNATANLKAFAKKYDAKYGKVPSTLAAEAYDSVYYAVAAVKAAGATSASALKTAMSKLNFTGGVCSNSYHADSAHVLIHENTVSKITATGSKNVAVYQAAPSK